MHSFSKPVLNPYYCRLPGLCGLVLSFLGSIQVSLPAELASDICTADTCVLLPNSVWSCPISKFLTPVILSANAYPPITWASYNLECNLYCSSIFLMAALLPALASALFTCSSVSFWFFFSQSRLPASTFNLILLNHLLMP